MIEGAASFAKSITATQCPVSRVPTYDSERDPAEPGERRQLRPAHHEPGGRLRRRIIVTHVRTGKADPTAGRQREQREPPSQHAASVSDRHTRYARRVSDRDKTERAQV